MRLEVIPYSACRSATGTPALGGGPSGVETPFVKEHRTRCVYLVVIQVTSSTDPMMRIEPRRLFSSLACIGVGNPWELRLIDAAPPRGSGFELAVMTKPH